MARVKQEDVRNVDVDDFEVQTKEYAFLKKQIEYLTSQQKELREKMFAALEERGEVDDKGNIVIELENDIEGINTVMKQRRVSRKIDEQMADNIIASKGLEDKLYKTIQVIDEDALMACLYSDELTEEEVDLMYPQQIVWALVLNKQ